MLEILGKTNIDFMGKRKVAFLLSGMMVLLGLIALVQIARGAANLGIDFAGGTAVQLKFEQPVRIDEARKALEANGLVDAELQEFGQDNKLLVRVKASTTIEEKIAERVMGVFAKEFPDNAFVVDLTTEIGPTIGKNFKKMRSWPSSFRSQALSCTSRLDSNSDSVSQPRWRRFMTSWP